MNTISGVGQIYLSTNSFSFDSFFNVCCDHMLNYFSENCLNIIELSSCFNILFKKTNNSICREIYMIEMIRWNLYTKGERDNIVNFEGYQKEDYIQKMFVDKSAIVTLIHNKNNLDNFDVIIRTPISISSFNIERPNEEEDDTFDYDTTYRKLNKYVNEIEEDSNEDKSKEEETKVKEYSDLSPEQIEEMIQSNFYLFNSIYQFNEQNPSNIKSYLNDNIILLNKIKQIDSIPLYRLFESTIIYKTNQGEMNIPFIIFINALGELISTDKEFKQKIIKLQYKDINDSIIFTVNNGDELLKKSQDKIIFPKPRENEILIFNYVTIIWKEFYTPRIGKELKQPICIVIKPYSPTHYRIKIKVSSNLDDGYKKIINQLFMNNMVIYVGKQFEVLSNYIRKMVVMLNTIVFSFIINENDDNNIIKLNQIDNIYKRYTLFQSN